MSKAIVTFTELVRVDGFKSSYPHNRENSRVFEVSFKRTDELVAEVKRLGESLDFACSDTVEVVGNPERGVKGTHNVYHLDKARVMPLAWYEPQCMPEHFKVLQKAYNDGCRDLAKASSFVGEEFYRSAWYEHDKAHALKYGLRKCGVYQA